MTFIETSDICHISKLVYRPTLPGSILKTDYLSQEAMDQNSAAGSNPRAGRPEVPLDKAPNLKIAPGTLTVCCHCSCSQWT